MVFLSQLLTITLLASFPIPDSNARSSNVKLRHLEKEPEKLEARINRPVQRIIRSDERNDVFPSVASMMEEELSFSLQQDLLDSVGSSSSQNLENMLETQDKLHVAQVDESLEVSRRHRGCYADELNEPENGRGGWNWMTTVKCSGLDNLSISLEQIPLKLNSEITLILISSSFLPTLDFSLFTRFPALQTLSVVGCNISELSGVIPPSLRTLDLSHNQLKSVSDSLFIVQNLGIGYSSVNEKSRTNLGELLKSSDTATSFDYMSSKSSPDFPHNYHLKDQNGIGMTSFFGESDPSSGEVGGGGNGSEIRNNGASDTDTNDGAVAGLESQLEVIDLSHNKITELPKSIFYLERLQSLLLGGNHLKCDFVWEKLWGWTEKNSSTQRQSILKDANETFCGVDEDVRVFQYTVEEVLQARRDLEETCATVDTSLCRDCRLYALQKVSRIQSLDNFGKLNKSPPRIAISLKLDCSSQNLTQLPPIPMQTWQLNISHNFIKDLSPLSKEEMYSNLINLDVASNSVNPESLSGSPFIDKYNYLNLQNNGLSTIPTYLLTSLKVIRGQGVTFLGNNYIECDCNHLKEIKPLLIENSKRIRDMKDIFCRNGPTTNTRLIDLQYADVCHMDTFSDTEFNSDLATYIVIIVEVVIIVLIILKLWHDQRTYRRTGNLPWCSVNMPRLPCDAMLESLKEPPNLRHRSSACGGIGGSAASSNTNIVQQGQRLASVSHIQLKDFRPGGSGGSNTVSERSIQIQPSSSGSRTCSV